jgi:DNA repair exonuclease SbcCD nuclease subunit
LFDAHLFIWFQLNGQGTTWDARSVLMKVTSEVIERKIPWVVIFGNHDDEDDDMSRAMQMKNFAALPYSLCEAGPKDVSGVGNYVLKVKSADPYVLAPILEAALIPI